MEVREYLSIRRAYNIVRQQFDADRRLTFSEFAILCRLYESGTPLHTSDIAEYQGCLRPTMTHRTKHLGALGYITRSKGETDHRNVVCAMSETGADAVNDLCERVKAELLRERSSSRMTIDRLRRSIDVMGAVSYMARDLVLVALSNRDDKTGSIGQLVDEIGFLQPTISMSTATLVREGLALRAKQEGVSGSPRVVLTDEGDAIGQEHIERIGKISVPRSRRKA